MTMTRDKIEELKLRLQSLQSEADAAIKNDGEVEAEWSAIRDVAHDALLALAERALEPQGQAHANPYRATFPQRVWLNVGDCNETELAEFSSHHEITWADSQIDQFDIEYVRADLASQLALPAGPVPENMPNAGPVPENKHDWPEDWLHENGKYLSRCHQCHVFFTGHKRRVTCKVCASPAVAQPVADERAMTEFVQKLAMGEFGKELNGRAIALAAQEVLRRAALGQPAEEGDKA